MVIASWNMDYVAVASSTGADSAGGDANPLSQQKED